MGRVVTTAFCVPRWSFFNFLKEINEGKLTSPFWKLRIAIIFRLCAKRSLVLLQAWLRRLVKKSWYMFRRRFLQRNFLEGSSFSPHFQKFSKNFPEFWRKNFGRVVTITFIHVHMHIFGKVIFLSKSSKFFFVVLGIWAANVWTLREIYLLPLPRLHSPLLKNHFWWKK